MITECSFFRLQESSSDLKPETKDEEESVPITDVFTKDTEIGSVAGQSHFRVSSFQSINVINIVE